MRTIWNINADWAFVKDMAHVPAGVPEGAEHINLPHSWNALDGQDGGADYFRGSCCYLKQITEELPEADRYYLEIRGANSSADVYVDGKKLAHHDGGYSTWRVDLTDALQSTSLLVIGVDNSSNDHVYPPDGRFHLLRRSVPGCESDLCQRKPL